MSPNLFSRWVNTFKLMSNHSNKPTLYEDSGHLSLHFSIGSTQSKMKANDPYRLMLGYTRTVMGFLLFKPYPEHITMIGLGGGSLAKYCYRHLPDSRITVVEINLEVIALRDRFHIPPNDERFTVLCEDGAQYVEQPSSLSDILIVDGFEETGQAPQLGSQRFYDYCYASLETQGVLVINLFGTDPHLNTYINRIRQSFKDQVIVVAAEDSKNKIVFAAKGKAFRLSAKQLKEKVEYLEARHPIDFRRVAKALKEIA
ncbi:MAG: transferase [Pseudomonadota bacterium]